MAHCKGYVFTWKTEKRVIAWASPITVMSVAIRFVGSDRIVWGSDYAGFGIQLRLAVMGLMEFQFTDDLRLQYRYLPLTEEDKAKIFGGNLARLLGIETNRRIGKK